MGICLLAKFLMGLCLLAYCIILLLKNESSRTAVLFNGLCLLELVNGSCFNGARTVLMGLSLLWLYLLAKLLMGLCLLAY